MMFARSFACEPFLSSRERLMSPSCHLYSPGSWDKDTLCVRCVSGRGLKNVKIAFFRKSCQRSLTKPSCHQVWSGNEFRENEAKMRKERRGGRNNGWDEEGDEAKRECVSLFFGPNELMKVAGSFCLSSSLFHIPFFVFQVSLLGSLFQYLYSWRFRVSNCFPSFIALRPVRSKETPGSHSLFGTNEFFLRCSWLLMNRPPFAVYILSQVS